MIKTNEIKSFWENNNDEFFQWMEDIRQNLSKNNDEYKNIKNKIYDIMDKNLNIQKILDDDPIEEGLTLRECREFSKLIILYNDLQDIIEKEIYFKGGMDAFYYFKKIGILK